MNVKHRLTETITRARVTGRNNQGEPTFGPQEKVKARIERKVVRTPTQDGMLHTSETQVFTAEEIFPEDRVWLPEDDVDATEAARKALAVAHSQTLAGKTVGYVTYF